MEEADERSTVRESLYDSFNESGRILSFTTTTINDGEDEEEVTLPPPPSKNSFVRRATEDECLPVDDLIDAARESLRGDGSDTVFEAALRRSLDAFRGRTLASTDSSLSYRDRSMHDKRIRELQSLIVKLDEKSVGKRFPIPIPGQCKVIYLDLRGFNHRTQIYEWNTSFSDGDLPNMDLFDHRTRLRRTPSVEDVHGIKIFSEHPRERMETKIEVASELSFERICHILDPEAILTTQFEGFRTRSGMIRPVLVYSIPIDLDVLEQKCSKSTRDATLHYLTGTDANVMVARDKHYVAGELRLPMPAVGILFKPVPDAVTMSRTVGKMVSLEIFVRDVIGTVVLWNGVLVHRDIHLSNILVVPGRAYIVDYGMGIVVSDATFINTESSVTIMNEYPKESEDCFVRKRDFETMMSAVRKFLPFTHQFYPLELSLLNTSEEWPLQSFRSSMFGHAWRSINDDGHHARMNGASIKCTEMGLGTALTETLFYQFMDDFARRIDCLMTERSRVVFVKSFLIHVSLFFDNYVVAIMMHDYARTRIDFGRVPIKDIMNLAYLACHPNPAMRILPHEFMVGLVALIDEYNGEGTFERTNPSLTKPILDLVGSRMPMTRRRFSLIAKRSSRLLFRFLNAKDRDPHEKHRLVNTMSQKVEDRCMMEGALDVDDFLICKGLSDVLWNCTKLRNLIEPSDQLVMAASADAMAAIYEADSLRTDISFRAEELKPSSSVLKAKDESEGYLLGLVDEHVDDDDEEEVTSPSAMFMTPRQIALLAIKILRAKRVSKDWDGPVVDRACAALIKFRTHFSDEIDEELGNEITQFVEEYYQVFD